MTTVRPHPSHLHCLSPPCTPFQIINYNYYFSLSGVELSSSVYVLSLPGLNFGQLFFFYCKSGHVFLMAPLAAYGPTVSQGSWFITASRPLVFSSLLMQVLAEALQLVMVTVFGREMLKVRRALFKTHPPSISHFLLVCCLNADSCQ